MGYREEILIQLYRILENNNTDARIYYRLGDKCKKASLTFFFKKLSLQKRIFCRRINYEISELEKEIQQISEVSKFEKFTISKKAFQPIPSLKDYTRDLLNYCYNREQEYLELYKNLLSQTDRGNIREMLLNQKHSLLLVIDEIKALETKIYDGKNERKVNYS